MPPTDDPFVAPGAGRDALPRAVGAGARVLRAPRAARGPHRGHRARRRARRASSIRSWPSARTTSTPCVDGRAALRADEGRRGRRAARADAHRGHGRARGARRPTCAPPSTRAASCWRSATAARRPTRWTWSRTSARRPRRWPARPAIDLTEDSAILTAIANDIGVEAIFARQVIAYGRQGDVAARAVDERQLGERDRGAGRGAPPRPAHDRDGRLRRRPRRGRAARRPRDRDALAAHPAHPGGAGKRLPRAARAGGA